MSFEISKFKEPKVWALFISGICLTLMTPFLGAPFLRVLQNVYGSIVYWVSGILVVAVISTSGIGTMALLAASVWLCVGLFGEFEKRGHGKFWAGMLAILVATLVSWQGPLILKQSFGVNLGPGVQESLEALVTQIENNPEQKAWMETMGFQTQSLLGQVPSMLALVFLMCLAFSLMLSHRIALLFRVKFDRIAGTPRLLEFRIPDSLVIVLILSFLFSFLKVDVPGLNTLALNLLQFLVGLYFFQGLAVLESSFLTFRIDPLIKLVVYILIVAQLFFLLSLVGLADFWLDFRKRLRNWVLKKSKEKQP